MNTFANTFQTAISMEREERVEKTKLLENRADQQDALILQNRGDICQLKESRAEEADNVQELKKKVDEGALEREELKNDVNEMKSTINVLTSHKKYKNKTKVAFACANDYFPIPARDSAKNAKKPAVAKKKDESSPPVTRTSTSSAKKSTPLRRSGRKSARRSEV